MILWYNVRYDIEYDEWKEWKMAGPMKKQVGSKVTVVVDRERMVNNVLEAAARVTDAKLDPHRHGSVRDAVGWLVEQVQELRDFDKNLGWEEVQS